jgi:FxLD family lantipeptide
MQNTAPKTAQAIPVADTEFDLDVVIIAGPVVPELLRSTSDNCGQTCESACTSCSS